MSVQSHGRSKDRSSRREVRSVPMALWTSPSTIASSVVSRMPVVAAVWTKVVTVSSHLYRRKIGTNWDRRRKMRRRPPISGGLTVRKAYVRSVARIDRYGRITNGVTSAAARVPGRNARSVECLLLLDVALASRVRRGRRWTTWPCATATPAAASRRQRRAHARTIVLHAAPRPDDAFRRIRRDGPVFGPFSGQRHRNRRVARMAVVRQQHAAVERCQRKRDGERLLVGHRIVVGRLVLNDVLGHTAEAFGDHHLRAVPHAVAVDADRRLVGKVRRLDDEFLAFPARARIAEILANRRADVFAPIGVEDARVWEHLGRERDHAW